MHLQNSVTEPTTTDASLGADVSLQPCTRPAPQALKISCARTSSHQHWSVTAQPGPTILDQH